MENSNHESFYVTARIGHRYDVSFYVSADDFPSACSAAEIKLANNTREPFIVTCCIAYLRSTQSEALTSGS
jgi:hypothetical protein